MKLLPSFTNKTIYYLPNERCLLKQIGLSIHRKHQVSVVSLVDLYSDIYLEEDWTNHWISNLQYFYSVLEKK